MYAKLGTLNWTPYLIRVNIQSFPFFSFQNEFSVHETDLCVFSENADYQ